MARDNEPYVPDSPKFYMTDAFTDNAVKFISEYGPKPDPYFLYLAFTSPHWPLHAWPEDIAKYRGKYKKGWDALRQRAPRAPDFDGHRGQEMAHDPARFAGPRLGSRRKQRRPGSAHGRLRRANRSHGPEHRPRPRQGQGTRPGGQHPHHVPGRQRRLRGRKDLAAKSRRPPGPADSFTSYGKCWANASNTPFRLYKHWVHEGGISTPFIAHWPAVIKQRGTITHQVGHIIDVMATCLDAGGTPYPKNVTPLEGKSLVPIFQGKQRPGHSALCWEHEGNRAVRQGDWKLVSRHPESWELYNMASDRTEMRDLSAQNASKMHEMTSIYDVWAKKCGVLPWATKRAPR